MFLIVSIFTLRDYGINWDEPKHLIRGQAYLHYILTGKHDFLDIPPYPALKGAPDSIDYNVSPPVRTQSAVQNSQEAGIQRSYFQSDFYTLDYYLSNDEKVPLEAKHSHPEVNDLLSAFTNYVFYQKLGIVGDLESYHLFIVLVTFALLAVIAIWVSKLFGIFPSIIATASLALYPLVFSESHFNVKDPVLMSFFGLAIFSFWLGFSKKRVLLIILSAIFAGFALGTKFNTLFLPFILGPWTLFYVFLHYKKGMKLIDLIGDPKVLGALLVYPIIALAVLYAFSPYLWQDPVGHFIQIVNYYKEIGSGTPEEQSRFIVWGWNTYPAIWIALTTPIPILILSVFGLFYSVFLLFCKKSDISLLVLLWLGVPIIRAMWPGANIYGGDRQIMEFVPAMAILSGIGAFYLIRLTKKNGVLLILLSMIFVVFEMVRIHPNENVYFNQLIGGLKGAQQEKIPSWGNTYGNAYLQGVNWLNKNAEPNAKLALAVNYISVIPRLKLRQDISLDNTYWSGPRRGGEYVMDMAYDWPLKNRYKYAYYETFLDPVYEATVEGVPLLKIWKNDEKYVKFGNQQEVVIKPISISQESIEVSPGVSQKRLIIDIGREVYLTRLVIGHATSGCDGQEGLGYISVSDDGQNWVRESDLLIDPESPYVPIGMDDDIFVFMFPARYARFIVINSEKNNPCIFKNYKVSVWVLNK